MKVCIDWENLFSNVCHRKSRYRQVHRRKSLSKMRFLDLYDASPARNFEFCVFDVDLGQNTTSTISPKTLASNFSSTETKEMLFFEESAYSAARG